MKVFRALSNNAVLSHKGGTEVVVTGWGVGFNKRPGDAIDPDKITRVFVPDDNFSAGLLASIPLEYLEAASHVLEQLPMAVSSATVVALADHLHMASKRPAEDNPLAAEVMHLYPQEFELAGRVLFELRDKMPLPDSERTAIALHLVNAGFRRGDLHATTTMTEVFGQLFDIISEAFEITIDTESVNVARFITHLRYFFIRAERGEQLEGEGQLLSGFLATRPDVVAVAHKLATVLALRLGTPLTKDETAYLALHVARLVDG